MHSLSAALDGLVLCVALFAGGAVAGSQNSPFSELSLCWRSCLDSSSGSYCGDSSLDAYTACICRLASQSFLTSTITCAQYKCPSSDLTSHLPLEALQSICTAVGKPIDSSALAAAESAQSSAAVVSDYGWATSSDGGVYSATTVTATDEVGTATAITVDGSSVSAPSGTPLTTEQWTGASATPVSSSSSPSSSSPSSLSPSSSSSAVVAGDGASSTSTSAAGSTSTAAVPASGTATTSTPAARSTATSFSSQTTTHSTSAGADAAVKTEGAPLGMQGTGSRKDAGSVLGLTVWLIAGIVWF